TAQLFKPRDAIRARLGGGRGGGGAAAPGQPQFPANGASINYYLAGTPNDRVTIDILDAAGKVVRSYSSDAARAIADVPAAPTSMPEDEDAPRGRGGSPPVRLTTS